jgi:hypothetical protein
MSRSADTVTWEKSARKGFAGFWFASSVIGYLCSPETPRHPYVGAGVHCVPEEGWSPAEPEHWGEAPRRCCSSLRRVDRCASPLVAERVCARVAASGRGGQRARERERGHRVAFDFTRRRCEVAVAPCRVSRANDDVDHRGRDHDDDSTADHNDHRAAADDHDDRTPAPADHNDDRAAGGRGDEQRRR